MWPLFGNWIERTSTTGGTGALTLSVVAGSPGWSDVFGASGARFVDYDVIEYADSARTQVSRAETGIGDLNLATLSLARTKILGTWDGAAYDNTAPAAISFGTTAANIRVRCGPTAAHDALNMPWVLQSVGDGIGTPGFNMAVAAGTVIGSGNTEVYTPILWPVSAEVDLASINVTTRVSNGTGVKGGVYEVGSDGLPGRQLQDLTSGGVWDNSATGIKSATQSFWLPRGWYYTAILQAGTATLRAVSAVRTAPIGSSTGTTIARFRASGNFTTGLPATAASAASLAITTTLPEAVFLRARL